MTKLLATADDIAAAIPDGALIALPPEYAACSMETIRALVRRRARGLRLLAVPQLGMQAELLIGCGAVAELEAAAVTLGEAGLAPRFTDAVKRGALEMRDSTCPAIHAALQASEKGVPFAVLRGIIGSDLLARRQDWLVGENPFAADDPIVYLKAVRPDIALLHAAKADRDGNVWIGVRREAMLMAHAAGQTFVTVEEIVEDCLLEDPAMAPGTIPALYVSAMAEARRGAWPLGVPHLYEPDRDHIALYARMATSEDGFSAYLDEWVLVPAAAE